MTKRFQTNMPVERLRAYVQRFVISENPDAATYTVLPVAGIVTGFQYAGTLSQVKDHDHAALAHAGITGFTDTFRVYRHAAGIGTVLVYFTPAGLSGFTRCPASLLSGASISLDHLFPKSKTDEVTARLSAATQDRERIAIVESFLLSGLRYSTTNPVLSEAVTRICRAKGAMQIGELGKQLYTSPSVLERQFRQHVGVTPKKFAAVVRFNSILEELKSNAPLTDICYRNRYFDQAHFIRDFKRFTGTTPEAFRRSL